MSDLACESGRGSPVEPEVWTAMVSSPHQFQKITMAPCHGACTALRIDSKVYCNGQLRQMSTYPSSRRKIRSDSAMPPAHGPINWPPSTKGSGYVVGEEPPVPSPAAAMGCACAHRSWPIVRWRTSRGWIPRRRLPTTPFRVPPRGPPIPDFRQNRQQLGLNDKLRPDRSRQFCFAFTAAHSNERFIQRDGQW